MFDVTALGELLIDFSPAGRSDSGYPVMAANPGGAPANFLAALQRYGCRTALIAKVGDDAFGRLLKESVRGTGADVSAVIADPDVFTTLAFVSLDGNGERTFSFARKPGADTRLAPEEVPEDLIASSRVFHFGTLSLTDEPAASATRRALELARKHKLLISADQNLRLPLWRSGEEARAAMEWCLRQADIVKISDDEVRFLWDESPEKGAERLLAEYGARLVYVTCGAKGCCAANAKACVRVPAPAGIRPVDTTGAGDIFGGAAMSRLLGTGRTPEELTENELESIVRFACAAASLSTQRTGGIASVPAPEEVLTLAGS
ncbi:MAG: carbohydrate kinase [Oscillospiraceae bacterium]|nr:carbohydrate kinase [Oscillospiraceae bacterium]